jgi:TonB family protein
MIALGTIQKRCLIGSVILHAFLVFVVLFGAAFFVSRQAPRDYSTLKVIPSRLIDGASFGGGNPNLPVTSEQQRGNPTAPPQAIQQPKVIPPAPKPPVHKAEVKRAEPKPAEAVKPAASNIPKDPFPLKKITRKNTSNSETTAPDKSTSKNKPNSNARQEAADKLAKQIGKTLEGLQQGFHQGTAVDVGGPGGVAYADYAQFVKQIYDDAWVLMDDLTADDGVALVKVTVTRDGRVTRAVIADRSGIRALDQSVQRALDKVTKLPPFPEGTKDFERTFTIQFSLKARRGMA